jgi:glycosyltransferase involved in cell wall biosynthesis
MSTSPVQASPHGRSKQAGIQLVFPFLKYVKPTWYFNLVPFERYQGYWIDYRQLSGLERECVSPDTSYQSEAATLRDAAFQAWQLGIMHVKEERLLSESVLRESLSIRDNYHFIRKHFRGIWALYILMIRILTFHNPFKELAGYYATRANPQICLEPKSLHASFSSFRRSTSQPLVSVIIPTLNRYKYLKDVLNDLEKQDYTSFEVIAVDQSEPFDHSFYDAFDLNIQVIFQEEKALWKARNQAVRISKGEFILLFDDDSRVEPDWISQHLRCIEFFNADISAGVSLSVTGGKIPDNYTFFRWADQLDTGNCMLRRDIFFDIGLFDRQFEKQRMGDAEFGLRCYLNGYRSISNPYAKRVHLKVASGGLRQMGSWDGFRPKNMLAPRPIPSVLYLYRSYFGNKLALFAMLIQIPSSIVPYRFKRSRKIIFLGRVLSLLLFPPVSLQVFISWKKASKKLAEGDLIEYLDYPVDSGG